MVQEEARKGPWTEQEDFQLVCFVGLFGDRRWDFIAKVSGLNRTGKSCRLRWVNYLHPGLKRGKMTPQEERLVLDLHSKWGNRWSRIARKLPGRTDNEIKNYWRTHMRKKAQERKRAPSPSSSSSNISSSPSNNPTVDSLMTQETGKESFYDTGGPGDKSTSTGKNIEEQGKSENAYSFDDIWKEIALSDGDGIIPVYNGYSEESCNFSCPLMASPTREYGSDSLWQINEEPKIFFPIDQFIPDYEHEGAYITG
ncbi:transcription factor MYB59 isoform X1 [Rhodamnia argentea]|uniref:Transcription factor MYB59 isoform X1 n=1 Tax=Rhodamnia argentea TaxID=178133 RepID=A0A8B8PT39_9MYRT|nr:transcription factor MYB59 isoform X1 [Rhodamnia argentea]